MKRFFIVVLALTVLVLSSLTVSAHPRGYYDNDHNWRHTHHNDYRAEHGLPFTWHDRYDSIREHHHLERIYDYEWDRRFPGLHVFRWNGHEGFWHRGHYVDDAVLFFNDNDELVSIGYLSDGVFINLREDHETYENHDSFFFSWWHHR